jgi:hypothetical protein
LSPRKADESIDSDEEYAMQQDERKVKTVDRDEEDLTQLDDQDADEQVNGKDTIPSRVPVEKRTAETDASDVGTFSTWESTKKRIVPDYVVLGKDEKGQAKFVRKDKHAVPIYTQRQATTTSLQTSSSPVDPLTGDDDDDL